MEDDTHRKDDDDDDDDDDNNERRGYKLKSKEQSSLASSLIDHHNDDAKTTTSSSTSPSTTTNTTTMNHITEKVTAVTKIMITPISSINWIKVIELCYTIPDGMIDYYHHYNNPICYSCSKKGQQEQDVDGVQEPSSSLSSNDNTNATTTSNNNDTNNTTATTVTIYKVCGQCKVVKYCCRQCQIIDWKKQHKFSCQSYQRMKLVPKLNATSLTTIQDNDDNDDHNDNTAITSALDVQSSVNDDANNNHDHTKHITTDIQQQQQKQQDNNNSNKYYWTLKNDEIKSIVRNELFHKIRFYTCPYAVIQYQQLGRGLVYIQSNCTIDTISYNKPIYNNGQTMNMIRNCAIHYLTLGEYDSEICYNDFEMYTIQKDIHTIVNTIYNPIQQIVIVMKFRCGHVALGIAPLIPDYNICLRLGKDYNYNNNQMLQLNLDE